MFKKVKKGFHNLKKIDIYFKKRKKKNYMEILDIKNPRGE